MARNQLAIDIKNAKNTSAFYGADLYGQLTSDCAQIALHRLGWGYKRIMRFNALLAQLRNEYQHMFDSRYNEADYLRVMIDREIADIVKKNGEFIPFEKRYPDVKPIDYSVEVKPSQKKVHPKMRWKK